MNQWDVDLDLSLPCEVDDGAEARLQTKVGALELKLAHRLVTNDDVLYLAGCSLAKTPGKSDNWVEEQGGLPEYICVGGESEVMTREGVTQIADLVGHQRLLARRDRGAAVWLPAEVRSFGVQPLVRVEMRRYRRAREVWATPEHRWFEHLGKSKKAGVPSWRQVETSGLVPGMRLASSFPQSSAVRMFPSAVGVMAGFTFGDGTRTRSEARANFFSKDAPVLEWFSSYQRVAEVSLGPEYAESETLHQAYGLPRSWKDLPSLEEGPNYLYGWLAGYFAADGRVDRNGVVELSSARAEELEFVRLLCTRLGVATFGVRTVMRRGYGAEDSALHAITLRGEDVTSDFFVLPHHKDRYLAGLAVRAKSQPDPWIVTQIEDKGRREEVFCAVVPEAGSFTLADNLLTGNCRVARSIHKKRGKSISNAIQIAVGVVKRWAAGVGDVDADTRVKAAAAVAQWEAKKAKARAT